MQLCAEGKVCQLGQVLAGSSEWHQWGIACRNLAAWACRKTHRLISPTLASVALEWQTQGCKQSHTAALDVASLTCEAAQHDSSRVYTSSAQFHKCNFLTGCTCTPSSTGCRPASAPHAP